MQAGRLQAGETPQNKEGTGGSWHQSPQGENLGKMLSAEPHIFYQPTPRLFTMQNEGLLISCSWSWRPRYSCVLCPISKIMMPAIWRLLYQQTECTLPWRRGSGFILYQTGPVLQIDTWIVTLISFSSTELCNHGPASHFSGNMFELKNEELLFCCSDLSLFWGKFPPGSNC